jgi:hypothetical protein
MRVPSRAAGLIPGEMVMTWEKIEGSAEALWASHSPISNPPNLEPSNKADRVTGQTKKQAVTELKFFSIVLRIA